MCCLEYFAWIESSVFQDLFGTKSMVTQYQPRAMIVIPTWHNKLHFTLSHTSKRFAIAIMIIFTYLNNKKVVSRRILANYSVTRLTYTSGDLRDNGSGRGGGVRVF